jgi:hypothetical protein
VGSLGGGLGISWPRAILDTICPKGLPSRSGREARRSRAGLAGDWWAAWARAAVAAVLIFTANPLGQTGRESVGQNQRRR